MCRSCASPKLVEVLDLGIQPLANNLLAKEDAWELSLPLKLDICQECWLLQITETIPPVQLFSEYPYFSSTSDELVRYSTENAIRWMKEFELSLASRVVEIASNDGYMLKNFAHAGIRHLGIEPAANVAAFAQSKGINTWCAFFGRALAMSPALEPADLILANNVLAHAPDINDFVSGIKILLAQTGTAILEFPYAIDMIANCEFDTIYHEHCFYFSLLSLSRIFDRHGLLIYHVEHTPIHGGSLRIFVSHDKGSWKESVPNLLAQERAAGVRMISYYKGFERRVTLLMNDLRRLIFQLKTSGASIAAYGASAKGSTLLNAVGLDSSSISFMVDRSPHKQGKFSPGMHIPILPVETLLEKQPDYCLLLTWNFADEIMAQQAEYRKRGGKFIIPIPRIEIV